MPAKRDLVTYGRRTQVKIRYREITGGSSFWGPWKEESFPRQHYEGGGRKSAVAKECINYFFLKKHWLSQDSLFIFAARVSGVLKLASILEILKMPVDIQNVLTTDISKLKKEVEKIENE